MRVSGCAHDDLYHTLLERASVLYPGKDLQGYKNHLSSFKPGSQMLTSEMAGHGP